MYMRILYVCENTDNPVIFLTQLLLNKQVSVTNHTIYITYNSNHSKARVNLSDYCFTLQPRASICFYSLGRHFMIYRSKSTDFVLLANQSRVFIVLRSE